MINRFFQTLIVTLIITSDLSSQNIINNQSYNFDNGSENWSSVAISNDASWQWRASGKAGGGTYWNDRDSIQSKSMGGAMVYDGDSIVTNNVGDPTTNYVIALESPDLNFSGFFTIYLKFHQYFRNFESGTRIEYLDGGGTWTAVTTPLNQNVVKNVETGTADYQVLDLSMELGDLQNTRIRFIFSGKHYFWILDDIAFYDGFPFPQTLPEYVGDSLVEFGYPYETESSDWPYVTDQLVVQFKTGTPEPVKQDLRDSLGAVLIDTCACNRLELWQMGDNVIADGDTLSSFGGSIGIQERIKGAQATGTIDGVDYNKFNYNQLKEGVNTMNLPFDVNPFGTDPGSDTAILVAILDTGIDLDHEILSQYIIRNNDEEQESNELDDDGNCLVDDWFGWNYVDDNNNPDDDHSHGTHVAGIIQQYMQNFDPACNYRIIPYKTHDYRGLANLFDVTCATYQAQIDGSKVLNESWGFYGTSSIILKNAIDTARVNDVLVVSAAGNDTTDLSTLPQYPACYPNSNIITVGSYTVENQTDTLISGFSNFDNLCVDILAPGDSILSTIPDDMMGYKTGTSMAAPVISAAAIWAYCSGHSEYLEVKNNILDCSKKMTSLVGLVKNGNVFDPNINCITPTAEIVSEHFLEFRVYPNPVVERVYIENFEDLQDISIDLYTVTGRKVFEKQIPNWHALEQQQLDTEGLPSGIYFITIRNPEFVFSFKLVKE